jgi:nicotinate-nucleotide--dimethylbenzimidazole phosphoribosyltransferase
MGTSLDTILKEIKPLDSSAMAAARSRQNTLTKPHGSLGRLEELSIQLAGIKGTPTPKLEHKSIIVMAADHGVAAETVSLYPQEVTRQMVLNFLKGGAAINVLAGQIGARVIVVDMGVKGGFQPLPGLLCKMIDFGTQNMTQGPAMTRQQAVDAIEAGIQTVEAEMAKRVDIIGTGDMGIGNTTASSAIFSAISGKQPKKITGRGTGVGDRQLAHKIKVIERALSINKPNPKDPLDVLSKVGGFEIAGLVGVILAGAAYRIPVVLDGFISGAAALVAIGLSPQAKDYLIAAHLSAEAGHEALLQLLGLNPLLNLNMRLGEGTGALIGIFLADAAARTLSQMATFAQAGVSEAKQMEPQKGA